MLEIDIIKGALVKDKNTSTLFKVLDDTSDPDGDVCLADQARKVFYRPKMDLEVVDEATKLKLASYKVSQYLKGIHGTFKGDTRSYVTAELVMHRETHLVKCYEVGKKKACYKDITKFTPNLEESKYPFVNEPRDYKVGQLLDHVSGSIYKITRISDKIELQVINSNGEYNFLCPTLYLYTAEVKALFARINISTRYVDGTLVLEKADTPSSHVYDTPSGELLALSDVCYTHDKTRLLHNKDDGGIYIGNTPPLPQDEPKGTRGASPTEMWLDEFDDIEGSRITTAGQNINHHLIDEETNQKESNKMTDITRSIVKVVLIDQDAGLDAKLAMVHDFGEHVCEGTIEDLKMQIVADSKISGILAKHNALRTEQVDLDILQRTGNEVKLRARKLSELTWKINKVA